MDSRETLKRLTEQCTRGFESESLVRSFREYLDEFLEAPERHGRTAARYLVDCLDHHGTEKVPGIGGSVTRWKLFDAPFDEGRDRLVGQEDVQREFHQAVSSFAREGRADKLIMLHGPNGSAKTTFCELLFRGLEAYSREPEGALHRFSWVFPTREAQGKRLGFTEDRSGRVSRDESYAYLAQEEIAAKIACELKDPPIFLLPAEMREDLLGEHFSGEADRRAHRRLFDGELCAKCKKIFDGLYRVHRGNLLEVLRHVQVERYFVSQRYRRGAVRIAPQTHVDASEVQVTADRSVAALPAAFHDMSLFVPVGDLVDGNRGLLEFSDFLKRPLEMNKYLLTTCEKGVIMLPTSIAHLDAVLVATSNEAQLDEFKVTPIFTSFNARMDLIPVPYLLRVSEEQRIYDELVRTIGNRKHVAPHVQRLAATWSVLCRLHRPDPENYPAEARSLMRELKPLEKAWLYDDGSAPERLKPDERQLVRSLVSVMRDEYRDHVHYEGRYGPSAREIRAVLMDCRYDVDSPCVSPPALFKQLRRLVKDKSLHAFLRIEPDGGYHDAEAFIQVVQDSYLDQLNDEVRDAMQLVPADEYRRVFHRYVENLVALRKKERVRNPVTGEAEQPDERLLEEVESVIAGEVDADTFRDALLGRVGAYRVEHADSEVDPAALFPEAVRALHDDYYRRNAEIIQDVRDNVLRHGTEDLDDLDAELRQRVVATMEALIERHGYCEACAKEAVAYLSRHQPTA
jgi:predicted Ser/Thr protein kinase